MTIIRAPRLAKHNKGDIKSASLSPRIKEVFDLAGISTLFEIYPSKDEAVESYKI
jgi:anti-anti-sigma regulatory factor